MTRKKMLVAAGVFLVVIVLCVSVVMNRRRIVDLGVSQPELAPVVEPVMSVRRSVVSTMIQADQVRLQQFLESEAEDWSYSDEGHKLDVPFGEAEGDLTVMLDGSPRVNLPEGLLVLEIPLRFASRVRWKGELLGLSPSLTEDLQGSLVARVFMRPRFTPGWRLESNARVEFEWVREPAVELLGYRLSLKKWISPVMEDWIRENTEQIDAEINDELRLEERAAEEWKKLGEPVELRSDPGLWLSIQPESVHIPPPEIEEGLFRVRIHIPLYLRLVSGQRPAPIDPGPLPVLETGNPRTEGLVLAVPVLLRYEDLEAEAEKHFANSEVSLGDDVILSVADVSLQGGGGEILVGLDLAGKRGGIDLEGRVYLRGSPVYDAASGLVRIEGLRFDVITEDRLSRVASWLLKPLFVEKVGDNLVFSVEDLLARARTDLEEDWSEQRLDENLVLRGAILALRLARVFPATEGLMMEVEATGQATLDFEPR